MSLRQIIFFVLAFLGALVSCKKYPDSNLWFKDARNIPFMEGHLTHYIVNGVDSVDFLDSYFYNDIYNNPYAHKFSDLETFCQRRAKGFYEVTFYKPEDYRFPHSIIENIECEYLEKGKKLKLYKTKTILETFRRNIFVSDDIVWEIIYLKRKDRKREMKGSYNGNTYEIQFN